MAVDGAADVTGAPPPVGGGGGERNLVAAATTGFLRIEQGIYVVLGVLLSLAALIAVAGAGRLLWVGLQDWTSTGAVFEIIDRLLFVLMLVEILYTIRASLQTGGLTGEPFLLVGLIACIRRVLVISLEASNLRQDEGGTVASGVLFRTSMIELAAMAILITVLVAAICLLRKYRSP